MLFQTVEREFFLESYQRSGRYREQFARTIRDAGMPEDLAWLPLIESGFKVKALSRARALGLWQFIPSTGYKFGLKRNDWVDERLDPEKSTMAAIAYMKELHQIFGDWATVLAAYNCGEAPTGDSPVLSPIPRGPGHRERPGQIRIHTRRHGQAIAL
jgi:membrane-bound lytic murein transglycosylase D